MLSQHIFLYICVTFSSIVIKSYGGIPSAAVKRSVNSKGQVTLPASCRKVFDIRPGDTILVLGDENKGGIAMVKIGGFMDDLGKLIRKDKE